MTKIFTPELLLQYIYQETSELENQAIKIALDENEALKQIYAELLESIALLDEVPLLGIEDVGAVKTFSEELAVAK